MTRVSSLGASNAMMRQFLEIQKDLFGYGVQAATEKRSDKYSGVARQSEYMINLENVRTIIEKYRKNNKNEHVRQTASAVNMKSAKEHMEDFRKALLDYKKGGLQNEQQVDAVQRMAFKTMKSLEGLLNTKADGRYMYSGSRVYTEPSDLKLQDTLEQFQARYNGRTLKYPQTREAHLSNTVTAEGPGGVINHLRFTRDNGADPPRSQITMSSAAQAAQYEPGSVITITGAADPRNNGEWTIASVNGAVIEVETEMMSDSGGADATAAASFGGEGTEEYPINRAEQLTFTRDNAAYQNRSTVTAGAPGAFANLHVGEIFTVTDAADPRNNGVWTVAEKDGDTIVVETKMMTHSAPSFDVTATPAAQMTFADGGAGDDTVTAAAGVFSGLTPGERIRFDNTAPLTPASAADHDAAYTVISVSADGGRITVQRTDGSDAGFPAGATSATARARVHESAGAITANGYYEGDTVSRTHRVDKVRSYKNDITAIHPAFEKAFRAMGIMAQGVYGAEGGLDQNPDRIEQAKYLIESALDKVVEGTPPPDGIGGEQAAGSIQQLEEDVGFNLVMLDRIEKSHKNLSTAFANRIGDIENVDKTEVLALLLNEQRVFQASLQSFARLNQLSLSNFL